MNDMEFNSFIIEVVSKRLIQFLAALPFKVLMVSYVGFEKHLNEIQVTNSNQRVFENAFSLEIWIPSQFLCVIIY